MAGLPSRTKRHPQGRSARTANEEREGLPRIDIENAQGFENSPPPQRRRRNASFSPARNDLSSETASSSKQESPGRSTRLSNTSPDLLWITTDKPADFKDAKIQRMISRHVMRDYQQKDQSKKESGRSTRRKNSAKSPSDDDVSVTSTSSQLSLTPMVEISRVPRLPVLTFVSGLILLGLFSWKPFSQSIYAF